MVATVVITIALAAVVILVLWKMHRTRKPSADADGMRRLSVRGQLSST